MYIIQWQNPFNDEWNSSNQECKDIPDCLYWIGTSHRARATRASVEGASPKFMRFRVVDTRGEVVVDPDDVRMGPLVDLTQGCA